MSDVMNLTVEDMNVLLEAMSFWVIKDLPGDMMADFLSTTLPPEMQNKMKEEKERKALSKKQEERRRKELAEFIKAKLVMAKHKLLKIDVAL